MEKITIKFTEAFLRKGKGFFYARLRIFNGQGGGRSQKRLLRIETLRGNHDGS
jgi:hypothetical protein